MRATLSKEAALFEKMKSYLFREGQGKYVVIQGETLLSFFDTEEKALREGYQKFGADSPFLVRKVTSDEGVHVFSPSFEHYGINPGHLK
jgi:hypothetical protein